MCSQGRGSNADSVSLGNRTSGSEYPAVGLKCVNADVSGIHGVDEGAVGTEKDGRVPRDGGAWFDQLSVAEIKMENIGELGIGIAEEKILAGRIDEHLRHIVAAEGAEGTRDSRGGCP